MQWKLTLHSLTCAATIQLSLYHYAKESVLILELQNVDEPQGRDAIAYVRLHEGLQVLFSSASEETKAAKLQHILNPTIFGGPKRLVDPVDQATLQELLRRCNDANKKDFVFAAAALPPSASSAAADATAAAASAAAKAPSAYEGPESEKPTSEVPTETSQPMGERMIGEAMGAIEGLRQLYVRYTFAPEDTAAMVVALLEAMKRDDLPTTHRAMAATLLDAAITTSSEGSSDASVTGTTPSYDATSGLKIAIDEPTELIGQVGAAATSSTSDSNESGTTDASNKSKRRHRPETEAIPAVEGLSLITREDVAVQTAGVIPSTLHLKSIEELAAFIGVPLPAPTDSSATDVFTTYGGGIALQPPLQLSQPICKALRTDRRSHMELLGRSLEKLVAIPTTPSEARATVDLVSRGDLVSCLVRFAVAWKRSDSSVAIDKRVGQSVRSFCEAVGLLTGDSVGVKGRDSSEVHSRLGATTAQRLQDLAGYLGE